MSHKRTITRFCDDAGLRDDDQVDLAEFIVAARYLGTEATDEELMQTFFEMERGEITAASARDKIAQLMETVQETYGYEEPDSKNEEGDDEIVQLPMMEEDAAWQDIHFDTFIREAGADSKLQIAKDLMLTTSLDAVQVASITGVDVALLEEWDDDDFEDYDTDDDLDESMTQTMTQVEESVVSIGGGTTISITADQFNKAVVITPDEMFALNNMLSGGVDAIADDAENALILLRKFKAACQLTPSGQKRTKTLKRIASRSLNHSNNPNLLEIPEEKDELGRPTLDPTQKSNVFPRKYRVVVSPGALIKEDLELDSFEVAKLPLGTLVTVAEIVERRARLIEPLHGWCSVTSKNGKVILQKESTSSPEMAKAVHAARSRATKLLILKSITTLEDATCQRILEKSDWNLRRAIEAFYIAKYKTAAYLKTHEAAAGEPEPESPRGEGADSGATLDVPGMSDGSAPRKGKKGWWKKWKKYIRAQEQHS